MVSHDKRYTDTILDDSSFFKHEVSGILYRFTMNEGVVLDGTPQGQSELATPRDSGHQENHQHPSLRAIPKKKKAVASPALLSTVRHETMATSS